jgi:hypothetical protein
MEERISFCITCKGRLCHLRETLPHNLALARDPGAFEFVVLDYNSEDGLNQWAPEHLREAVSSGLVNCYRTTRPQSFFMAHAKNAAHRLAQGEIVCNLDADNFMNQTYLNFVQGAFKEHRAGIFMAFNLAGFGSRIAFRRADFLALGGYNEALTHGWGFEDSDLIIRAIKSGLKMVTTPNARLFGRVIEHEDQTRNVLTRDQLSRAESAARNFNEMMTGVRAGETVANRGTDWGRETVVKNFDPAQVVSV